MIKDSAEAVITGADFRDPSNLKTAYLHLEELSIPYHWGRMLQGAILGIMDAQITQYDESWVSRRGKRMTPQPTAQPIGIRDVVTIADRDVSATNNPVNTQQLNTPVPNSVGPLSEPVPMSNLGFVDVKQAPPIPPGLIGTAQPEGPVGGNEVAGEPIGTVITPEQLRAMVRQAGGE